MLYPVDNSTISTDNNTSRNSSSVFFYDDYLLLNALYVVLGLIDLCCNLTVVVAVFGSSTLRKRKEVFLVGAYSTADTMVALEYLWSGARRLWMYSVNDRALMTPIQCMEVPPVDIYIFSQELLSMLFLSVSIDRFIFINNTMKHLELGNKYLSALVGIPVMIAAVSLTAAWTLAATGPDINNQQPICFVTTIVPPQFYEYHSLLLISACSAAIVLYIITMFLFRFKQTNGTRGYDAVKQRQIQRQRKLTKTLSIMATATLIAFVLPNILLTFNTQFPTKVTQVLNAIMAMHSLFNVLCYLSRPSDIRTQILKILVCNRKKYMAYLGQSAVGSTSRPMHNLQNSSTFVIPKIKTSSKLQ